MKMTKYLLLISLLLVTATQSLIASPAIQAFDEENYELAKSSFKMAVEKDRKHFDSWTNLGVMNYHLKSHTKYKRK